MGPASICVQFVIDSGHRLVVTDPAISIRNQNGQLVENGIPKPWVWAADGVAKPWELAAKAESEAPTVKAHVSIELIGGVDPKLSSLERALSKTAGRKKYNMAFEAPKTDGGEIYVELPTMLLDSNVVLAPHFRFRRVTEDRCWYQGIV
jgi:hypothetical protein